MVFSNEVWNVAEASNGSGRQIVASLVPDWRVANANADALNAMLLACVRADDVAGVLYFPPGRYYVGRPSSRLDLRPSSSQDAVIPVRSRARPDIMIPPNVALRFAPGATLVPHNYQFDVTNFQSDANRYPYPQRALPARPSEWPVISARPEDDFRVFIEIQGGIEAGIHGIFDAVLQSEASDGELAPDALIPAGVIMLTRDEVRAVHPEWWGAAPLRASVRDEALAAVTVRRITMALQETIQVAHTRRGVAYVEQAPPLASVPIILTGRYVIDQELQVGERWRNAQARRAIETLPLPPNSYAGPDPDPGRPVNHDGFILRGARPPTRTGGGTASVVAHRTFFDENKDLEWLTPPARVPVGSGSLLGVRSSGRWSIENVTFDANFAASRCLTVHNPDIQASQMIGIQGCEFKNALRRLVMLGGEEVPPPPKGSRTFDDNGKAKDFVPSYQYSSNTDLLGFRMVRCRFDTGGVAQWRDLRLSAPVGVMCRAGNALFFAFEGCVFVGPAAPMIHDVEGGTSFVGCFFHTKWLDPPTLPITPLVREPMQATMETLRDGVDVLLDAPPKQTFPPAISANFQAPPSCHIRDSVSRSPMLISNFRNHPLGNPMSVSVQLVNVEHLPTIAEGEPLPPAILWAGSTEAQGRLVLTGCRFVRPETRPFAGDSAASATPYRYAEPVCFDFWAFARDLTQIESPTTGLIDDWAQHGGGAEGELFAAVRSSRGHVIDMGNLVEGASELVSTALVEARLREMRASAEDLARVHALRVVERHNTVLIGSDFWGRLTVG